VTLGFVENLIGDSSIDGLRALAGMSRSWPCWQGGLMSIERQIAHRDGAQLLIAQTITVCTNDVVLWKTEELCMDRSLG
jgi:hypothetical protein